MEDLNQKNDSVPQVVISSIENKIQGTNVYDPSAYVKATNIQNPQGMNMISTQAFLKQVDLRCEDHFYKLKEDVQATRYCTECKVLCCDSCVIDYHHSHIQSAKTKIEDYFRQQKMDLEEMKAKINNSIKYKVNIEEINTLIDTNEQIVKAFFNRRRILLEEIKSKVDIVLNEEASIEKFFQETIQNFFREECYKKLEKPLSENEGLLGRIQTFLRDFDAFDKTQKVQALKNDQVKKFREESDENTKMIKEETQKFKGKSKVMERKIQEILNQLKYCEGFFSFEKVLGDITTDLIESKKKINMLKYDEIIEDKMEQYSLPKPNPKPNIIDKKDNLPIFGDNKNNPVLNNFGQNNKPDYEFGKKDLSHNEPGFSFPNNMPMEIRGNEIRRNDFGNFGGPLIGDGPFNPMQFSGNNQNPKNNMGSNLSGGDIPKNNGNMNNPIDKKSKCQMDYDYFISLKPKSDELIIFSVKTGYASAHVNVNDFQNPADSYFTTFPDNCKYINLGSSILLTGGYINKSLTSNCYLILVNKNQRTDQFEVNVMPYGKMKSGRERHNIIFLEDRNSVLVCSGFFNNGSEITNLDSGEWTNLGQMNEVRGNATIAYVNNRYVYVIGGYKVQEGRNLPGIYHGNCEFFDLNDQNLGWRQCDFGDNNLKLSAMGVVPISSNTFLICGGFDGKEYRKEVYKVEINGNEKPKLEQTEYPLPGYLIFLHSSFLKNGNVSVNLELGNSAVIMNLNNFRSHIQSYNK